MYWLSGQSDRKPEHFGCRYSLLASVETFDGLQSIVHYEIQAHRFAVLGQCCGNLFTPLELWLFATKCCCDAVENSAHGSALSLPMQVVPLSSYEVENLTDAEAELLVSAFSFLQNLAELKLTHCFGTIGERGVTTLASALQSFQARLSSV